ncbi:cupin domain-containing protein [Cohnella sp. CFH 77786]|uniref:sugar phosphate nucleotidyltransferase n=1 Tax=Cohnella sp. CFH 77786 TaxID=2662265 RepID=UPI001C60E4AD|nr:sugar phosphate nucleotidyltransferase [Cohnella sp. CFH 77786]MBW5448363.1 cupin domain-containing protein [Cohnella sp. CFH 77786]
MKIVLLSGGSGKRLWPLSNDTRSKQFLKVLRNEEGIMESMVQRVWRQLERAQLGSETLVAVGAKQKEIIQSQLPDSVVTIVEPTRRDTFPAIALTAAYLYSIEGVGLDEVVAVLPVDPYVEQDFFAKVRELEDVVRESDAELALIGVQPTYPSAKYGYIVPKAEEREASAATAGFRAVRRFVEKPSEAAAEGLIAEGALWNCGVFAFKLDTIIRLLIDKGLPIHYEEMVKQYDRLPSISFDYEVVEKVQSVVVTRYDGYWKDLGTWNTLTEEMNVGMIGRGIVSPDSVNTHVVNELDMLVTVIGLSDVVVAASPDGILVADKARSPKLKDMLKDIEQRPMYEEKRWGTTRVMDFKKLEDGREVLTRAVRVNAGQCTSYHFHLNRDEYWTVACGTGTFVMNNVISTVHAGDTQHIPAGAPHSVLAETDMEWIEVQMGSRVSAEDVIRLYHDWEEIERHCGMTG